MTTTLGIVSCMTMWLYQGPPICCPDLVQELVWPT